jgi:hypothetical protein
LSITPRIGPSTTAPSLNSMRRFIAGASGCCKEHQVLQSTSQRQRPHKGMCKHACMARDDLRGRCSHGGGWGGVAARCRLQRAQLMANGYQRSKKRRAGGREVPPTEAHDSTAGVHMCARVLARGDARQHLPVGRASEGYSEYSQGYSDKGYSEYSQGWRLHDGWRWHGRAAPARGPRLHLAPRAAASL